MKRSIVLLLILVLAGCDAQDGISLTSSSSGSSSQISSSTSSSIFSSTQSYYTVTWNVDGNITTEIYSAGEVPVFKGVTAKPSDSQYSYTFTGWYPNLSVVNQDVTYVAQYSSSVNHYTVTWNVDGNITTEEYEYGQTPVFKGSTEKAGNAQYSYTFVGWSPSIGQVVQNTTYVAQYSSSVNHYTVTWNIDGNITTETYAYGQTPTYKNGTPTKQSDQQYGYSFREWSPSITQVTSDVTYKAIFSSTLEKAKIIFDLNGGTTLSSTSPIYKSSINSTGFFFDCFKEGWNFRGWSYNGTKVFDEKGDQLTNPELAETMTFVAVYSQTAIMTITTNLIDAGVITGQGEYSYNTYVDVSAHPNKGYVFVGWYYQNTLLSNTEDYKYMMWSEDVTLEARFKLDSYLMNIHTNNEEYGLVLLKSPLNFDYLSEYQEYRDYTTQVTIAAYSKTDVRFLGWYDTNNNLVETNAVYSFTMPNHDYTLEAKWNYFTVSYNLNGGTNNPNNPTSYTIESTGLSLLNPTKTNYDFLGWQYKGNYVSSISPSWLENIELNAIWKAHNYSITYNLNGGTNDSSNPNTYSIESETITLKSPSKHGYAFDGWYTESSFVNKITQIVSGGYGDLNLYAKWIPVQYSITYNLNDGTNSENNPSTYTIESSFALNAPTKTGYTFLGWFDSNDNQVTSIEAGTAGALTLTAHWTANLNNLSVTSEDTNKGTVSIAFGSGYSDETITVLATPVGDCVFKGWYHESTKVSDDEKYSFVMPLENYSLEAKFATLEEWKKDHGAIPVLSQNGKTITYGLYPQTNVNDSLLISELNKLTTSESNGWYLYKHEYYAKASATSYGSDYKFYNGTTISNGTTYWFKCEPIVWNVLTNNDGTRYLLSSLVLDTHRYAATSNNYMNSEIRSWLNSDFYNSAFALDNSHIQTTTVDNSASTTDSLSSSYACANTQDKVFLPSYQDFLNSSYGFSTSTSGSGSNRACRTTDWARVRGALVDDQVRNNGFYWTRSPNYNSNCAWYVAGGDGWNHPGMIYFNNVDRAFHGVRPSISLAID